MVFDELPLIARPAGDIIGRDFRRGGIDAAARDDIAAVARHNVEIGSHLSDIKIFVIKLTDGFCPLDVLGHFFYLSKRFKAAYALMHASRAIFLGRVSMPPAGSVWPTVSIDTVDVLLPLSVSDMLLTPMPWL